MPISIIVRLRHGRYDAGGDRPSDRRMAPASSPGLLRARRSRGRGCGLAGAALAGSTAGAGDMGGPGWTGADRQGGSVCGEERHRPDGRRKP